jgi:hypothetical protein
MALYITALPASVPISEKRSRRDIGEADGAGIHVILVSISP